MLKRLSTDTINTILIIGAILLVLEVVFFNGGLIFSVVFSGVFMYFGWKNYRSLWGKVLFWIGAVSVFFTILNMMAVRFLIIVGLAMLLINYYRSKDRPKKIEPVIIEDISLETESSPIMEQKLFGDQATPDHSYRWHDINIHGGFGDRIIDLSHTVLPEDEAVISIRHFIGNIHIYIPYEVEVSIHHSALLGRAAIFQYRKSKLLNQTVSYQTPDYKTNKPRVKVVTSVVSGDIEVKRV
ncbi:cell wall-active antibiotics response protein LiaF [Halobacillus sp. Marseille-Q1614]|uniref:cell wall-active antibiotics response protein LiaF n=1 Tax=Halobacillus sp. Marseille-Q1614 TaxID=2709134 RepID=UPI00156DE9B6|nr:cell wall-active antibiotics response protein LiaF [Halobacillus sp. Marseille-Q1614]